MPVGHRPGTAADRIGDAASAPAEEQGSAAKLRSRAIRHSFVWLLIFIVVLLQGQGTPPAREVVAWGALIILGAGIFSLSRCTSAKFWSPAVLFLLVLGVFHLGLVGNILTGTDPEFPRPADYVWYDGPVGIKALSLTTLGMVAYTVSALTLIALRRPTPRRSAAIQIDDAKIVETSEGRRFSNVGAVILLAGVAAWFLVAISKAGIEGLFGSYMNFLSSTSTTNVYLTYPLIGVGLGMTLISRARGLQKTALVGFALFAALGFFLGLRGEVLFPIVVGASVLATRKRMPNTAFVAIGVFVLLTVINAGKQIRQLGIGEAGLTLKDATPIGALAELGSTLRVVATVVGWHDSGGEEFRDGDTYTVTIVRFIEQLFGGARVSAGADFRLFNSEILTRAGGIGGSVIGEAYHNFATAGVVVVLILLGLIFARFSVMEMTPMGIATYVVIAVPLFNHVRNSFVPVVPAVVVGLLLVIVLSRFGKSEEAKHRRTASKSENR